MAKDKLVVIEDHYQYRIQWLLQDDDDDMGAILGQGGERFSAKMVARAKPENWEHEMATHVARQDKFVERDNEGFYWESIGRAKAVLKLINVALKDRSKRPWPSWALEAKANGWTPSKGWTP